MRLLRDINGCLENIITEQFIGKYECEYYICYYDVNHNEVRKQIIHLHNIPRFKYYL